MDIILWIQGIALLCSLLMEGVQTLVISILKKKCEKKDITAGQLLEDFKKEHALDDLLIRYDQKSTKDNGTFYVLKNEIHLHVDFLTSAHLFHLWLAIHEGYHALQKKKKKPWTMHRAKKWISIRLLLKCLLWIGSVYWSVCQFTDFSFYGEKFFIITYVIMVIGQLGTRFLWEIDANKQTFHYLNNHTYFQQEERMLFAAFKEFIAKPGYFVYCFFYIM